jgi:hypothetical protein
MLFGMALCTEAGPTAPVLSQPIGRAGYRTAALREDSLVTDEPAERLRREGQVGDR